MRKAFKAAIAIAVLLALTGFAQANPTVELTEADIYTNNLEPKESNSKEDIGVATYNVGAGNEEAARKENFDKTSDLLVDEIVNGDTDVAMLQEVGVDGRNTGGRDNHQEILESIFIKELGDDWEGSDVDRQSVDANGQLVKDDDGKPVYEPERYADTQVTFTNFEGESEGFSVTRERYNDDGEPVDWARGAAEGAVVVYQADMGEAKVLQNRLWVF